MATNTYTMSETSKRVQNLCRAAGVRSPWEAARIHAEQVLREYGKTTVPVNVRELCALRGIKVMISNLRECAARLLPVREGYIAQLHEEDRATRQSFSLCHELGHTLFDRVSVGVSDSTVSSCSDDTLEEALCDFIASELLMPTDAITRIAEGRTPGWGELWEIANTFGASLHAAVGRIQKLDIWPCILVVVQPMDEDGIQRQFALKEHQCSRSLNRNPIGSAMLVEKVMDFLNVRGDEVLRTGQPFELGLRLQTSLSIQGQYFRIRGELLGRVLIFKTPQSGLSKKVSFSLNALMRSPRPQQLELEAI